MLLNCLNCIKIALQISSHIQVKLQSRIKCKALCAHSLNTTMHGQAYGHITVYIYFNDPHGAIRAQSPRLASNSIGNFQLSNCPELCR